jgi:lincosamide nucleotidyltransferase A/C/D/E
MTKQISAETVLELLQGFTALGVRVWLDGGWGVDALLGEQTRPHADLDIVVQKNDLQAIETFLRGRGYGDVPRDDTRAWNFVLGDMSGNEIDVHVIDINDSGDGNYGPLEDGNKYPADALTGIGSIAGCSVLCMRGLPGGESLRISAAGERPTGCREPVSAVRIKPTQRTSAVATSSLWK